MQAVWDELFGGGRRVQDVAGSRISRTTRGDVILPNAVVAASVAPGQVLVAITSLLSNVSNHRDYFGVKRLTPAGETGDEFMVAKSFAARMVATYTQGGITYSYTYTDDNNRVSTRSSDSATETQALTPIFFLGQTLTIAPINYSLVIPDGLADLKWIETATEREWTAPSSS